MNDRDQTKDRLSDELVAGGGALLIGEEAFRNAFEGHGAVMYVVDLASFSIVDANEAALKFYGYDRATLLTKKIPDLNMTPEPEIRAEIKNAVVEGRSYYVFKHRLASGEVRDVEIYANPISIRGKDYSFSIVHDITDRRRAEEALRESEGRYRSLFRNNHSVMLIIDPENADIVDANPASCTFYGWSLEELTAKKITDINMFTKEQIFQEMEKAKSEQRRHFYFQHRLANGDIRDVEVYSGPIIVSGEKVLYSIIHDITDRKQAEKDREELINELQEALKEIKTLRGILPICSSCKKIRDDKGYWNQIEGYIQKHSDAQFSHGICPECAKKLYPDLDIYD